MSEIVLDPELLSEFIVESRELLDDFMSKVIELEEQPENMDVIGAIFRAAHTLKGSSAFFNLVHIKNFAHKLENLLDEVRNQRQPVTGEVIEILLDGGRRLQDMFTRLSSGDYGTGLTDQEDDFIKSLLAFLEKGPTPAKTCEDIVRSIAALVKAFKRNGDDPIQLINAIEDQVNEFSDDNIDDNTESQPGETDVIASYKYGGIDFSQPVNQANELLRQAEQTGAMNVAEFDEILNQIESFVTINSLERLSSPLKDVVEDYTAIRNSGMDFDPILVGLIKTKFDSLIENMEISVEKKEEIVIPPIDVQPSEPEKPDKTKEDKIEKKTMRIDEDKVDGFMNYVGELIVTAESFSYLQRMIEKEKVNPQTVRAFKNANQAFRELSGELQESLMEIRRVPIKGLLQKVNMMARELAHQVNKKVKIQLDGQDVQIDKSIAENLEGPLVHVVRNSLDHGLETSEDRIKAGKPPEGILEVNASADKEFFYLDVKDDGKGIDPEKIKKSALEKGVINEIQAASLTENEAVNLIFSAGFSTAAEITDVSGRGVGMDVVRNNVNQLNGSINVDSKPGCGTTIQLKIPLSVTLQVIKGLLVRVGNENFIISLDEIVESLRPAPGDLSSIEGRGEVIRRRGQIFPLLRLYEAFDIQPQYTCPDEAILVVIDTNSGRYGLMVDQVLGQQQVVVKELGSQFKKLHFVAGSATLGDGKLGLVLDAEGLVKLSLGLS